MKYRRIEALERILSDWVVVVSLPEVLCIRAMLGSHDPWLPTWPRLHGYKIDDSLVSSAHLLGYGDNYFLQSCYYPGIEGTA